MEKYNEGIMKHVPIKKSLDTRNGLTEDVS
ncbi:hypothetical protein E2C01_052903 [Portunus trituberculatus]|uniref:Uncharacterized protein n=1 Tax=Portunus trituberculatus TaxID=210409 RepID=A0A5B7GIY2_PORTR|nr:hypothetical protein [Portunus trituberculatus]